MVVMAHGVNAVLKRGPNAIGCKSEAKTGIGSRRIFPPHFKLQVLDSYRNDTDCKGNQRATARKYGIHRRQIQKWLQAESNLRNSVGKGSKSVECAVNPERKCGTELTLRSVGHRQRDDLDADAYLQSNNVRVGAGSDAGPDARVPTPSPVAYSESGWHEFNNCNLSNSPSLSQPPVPLDFTTHSRTDPTPLFDPASPIDLSLKRPISTAPGDSRAPVYLHPLSPTTLHVERTPSPSPLRISSSSPLLHLETDPDIWDLSTKTTLKRKHEDHHNLHSPTSTVSSSTKPIKLFKPYLDDLQDNSNSSEECQQKIEDDMDIKKTCYGQVTYHSRIDTHLYNNNNNICEFKSEYTSYTLHEMQPKKPPINYYYPINKGYNLYSSECDQSHYCMYEDSNILQAAPLKQRQSYSLDFKLRAIECYYQDEMCRGNQRAVATKYNIHRRQIQKWLKQEEELRQRNESVKQIHCVR